ncbi:MAG: hypothetical protein JWM18_575 [Chloroflexi bacterium]|jgi:hypothetical protein|nr:hypothetical protein [Chloroflexota bacterium]
MDAVLIRAEHEVIGAEPVDSDPVGLLSVLEAIDFERLLEEARSDFRRPVIACNITAG